MNNFEFEIRRFCSAYDAGTSKGDTTAAILNVFSQFNREATVFDVRDVLDRELNVPETVEHILQIAKKVE